MKKVRFITLGCKVNQYETQSMRESVESAGACLVKAEPADFVVINTCTVTSEADRENRYWIRRAKRESPEAAIVVTGCGVERNYDDYAALPEVDLVLSNHEKADVASRLFEGCASPAVQENEGNPKHRYAPLSISRSEARARAFVKIQDGCNHACSFCKVVLVRGRSRSRELNDVIQEVERLRDSGFKEIVFAGIQLGAYGLEWNPEASKRLRLQGGSYLEDVLEAAAQVEGIERLRLSSIEPMDVQPSLIETLSRLSKCVPHMHIPLQSGDREVLKRMNRRYEPEFYIDLIRRLKEAMPGFALTLDVMAGFPGETEEEFQNTVSLLRTVKPLRCHVFPYSRRDGTRAENYENLPKELIRKRVKILMSLSDQLGRDFRLPYVGKTVNVLVEQWKENSYLLHGLTPHYLKVCFQGDPDWVGQVVPVEILDVQGELCLGKAVR